MSEVTDLQAVDTPQGLQLTELEGLVVQKVAAGNPPKLVAQEFGIPTNAVNRLLAKEGVSDYLAELIDARNQALKAYLPTLLTDIVAAKVERALEGEDANIADASKKDVVDIVRVINDLIKTSDSTAKDDDSTGFGAFYQQVNILQEGK